jgi:hypothetical protein
VTTILKKDFSSNGSKKNFTHGWYCDEEEEIFVAHNGGSRSVLANEDESDQPTGGNIDEWESVERVDVGEDNLCTDDREHNDWDDDHKSPS